MFLALFREIMATILLKYIKYDHKIPLKLGTNPLNRPFYPLVGEKLEALREYIKDSLKKGYIYPLWLPTSALVLLVRKANRKWRVVIDYRGLNEITIWN